MPTGGSVRAGIDVFRPALNQATEDWYTDHVTLSAAKGLNGEMLRCAAQKLQMSVAYAGDSTSVKPSLAAFLRRLAMSRSRARWA